MGAQDPKAIDLTNVSGTPDPNPNLSAVASQADVTATVSSELTNLKHEDLELEKVLIATIPAKKVAKFEDPFVYNPKAGDDEEPTDEKPAESPEETMNQSKSYLIGDSVEASDAVVQEQYEHHPFVEFVRS